MNIDYYLGKSWSNDFDCWALCREFYQRELGINLAVVPVNSADLRDCIRTLAASSYRAEFVQLSHPVPGCIAEMGAGRPSHVGIYLETPGPRVLHNFYGGGVVCEPKPQLPIIAYWQHGSLCTTPNPI